MSEAVEDRDSCIPDTVKNFVFDLHDATRRSQVPAEARNLYVVEYKSLCEKYFANSAWPSPAGVSSECNADPIFLALYGELTTRHFHGACRTGVRDRIDSWRSYRHLFDTLLELANDPAADTMGGLCVPPEWAFAAMNEFVYQFQAFCQFRTNLGGRKEHDLTVLRENKDAWAVETVMFYLHGLVRVGCPEPGGPPPPTAGHAAFGTYAAVGLSRLECLLGDYTSCLSALRPLGGAVASVVPVECAPGGAKDDPLHGITAARATVAYHAGVSYLLLRRYRDAARTMSPMSAVLLRGLRSGTLRRAPGGEQLPKLADRMVALLAIVSHLCPAAGTCCSEEVRTHVQDRHGDALAKIDSGDEGYEELFAHACPKFVSPAVPNYDRAGGSAGGPPPPDASKAAYNLQVRGFAGETAGHGPLRRLRSYLKLYTSIRNDKLAAFNDMGVSRLAGLLCGYKLKMFQLENSSLYGPAGVPKDPLEGSVKSALDVEYYVEADVVYVEGEEDGRGHDEHFLKQIESCNEISGEVATVPITV